MEGGAGAGEPAAQDESIYRICRSAAPLASSTGAGRIAGRKEWVPARRGRSVSIVARHVKSSPRQAGERHENGEKTSKGQDGETVDGTYSIVLVEKGDDLGRGHRGSRPRRGRRGVARIRGIGVVAVAMRGPGMAVGPRALVLAERDGEAALGAVAARKLLTEKALEFAEAATGDASLGALAAGRCGDASHRGSPCVGTEIGRVGRLVGRPRPQRRLWCGEWAGGAC